MLTSVKERLEDAASSVSLTRDGFEPIGNSVPLVMSTPLTITVTTLFVTQWSTAFIVGGSDHAAVGKSLEEGQDSPSLEDLIRLHE